MKRVLLSSLLLLGSTLGCEAVAPESNVSAAAEPVAVPITVTAPPAEPDPAHFTVTGLATLDIAPDVADVSITLNIEAPRPRRAVANLRSKQQALVEQLDAVGVRGTDLQTSRLSLTPVTQWVGGTERVIAYRASLSVTASTTEFDRVAELMEAGATAGATMMHTHFRNSEIVELKKRVRTMALEAAMAKAQQMATVVGIEVGRVRSMSETPSGQAWAIYGGVQNVRAALPTDGGVLSPVEVPLSLAVEIEFEIDREAEA